MKIASDFVTAVQNGPIKWSKVDVHHTAIGDGHSAGYEVNLII